MKTFSWEFLRIDRSQGRQTRDDLLSTHRYAEQQEAHDKARKDLLAHLAVHPEIHTVEYSDEDRIKAQIRLSDNVTDISHRLPAEHVAKQREREFPLSGVRVILPEPREHTQTAS